ncbi:alpha/beta hydrolase [Yinghuangia seranimata]|uniref:alpha/beta hydrolase n=1 Tax=Yinghuangia seranimata TaxID=408067 RepID=UPI00248B2D9F|nr:alpha/beta hydrolase family protein [Yinghuangia seranimata]MDI2132108.1 alpha/beta hydrolase family protein [Yinghuangia seranimata]
MISRRGLFAPMAALPLAAVLPGSAAAAPSGVPAAPAVPAAPPRHIRVTEERRDGRVLDLTVESPSLGGSAVVRLLLPQGWRAGSGHRWPVLYLLHGATGDHRMWSEHSDVAALTEDLGVLVVIPDGGPYSYYSNWWNHGKFGAPAWEAFHLDELRTLLEARYGAGHRRAVAGLSMGGQGAFKYAAARPGMFLAAASYSGVLNTTSPRRVTLGPYGDVDFAAGQAAFIRGYGADPLALWGDRDAQAAIWAANNPTDLAYRLRGIPLYISAGDGTPGPLDPPGTAWDPNEALFGPMSNDFAAAGRRFRLRMTLALGKGTHTMPYWQHHLHESLPMLMGALGVDHR